MHTQASRQNIFLITNDGACLNNEPTDQGRQEIFDHNHMLMTFIAPAVIMDELASKWVFSYTTAKAAIDESKIGSRKQQPGELVTLLAKAKAESILEKTPMEDGYLVTCDQVSLKRTMSQHIILDCWSQFALRMTCCPTIGVVLREIPSRSL